MADWALHPTVGDRISFIFDGGTLTDGQNAAIKLQPSELSEYRHVSPDNLSDYTIPRLTDRIRAAIAAASKPHCLPGERDSTGV